MAHKKEKRKLSVLEIREDPKLIRLHKALLAANAKYHERIMKLYRENDIKPLEITGLIFSDNVNTSV